MHDFILRHRDDLIDEWHARVRSLKPAQDLSVPALVDHVPEILSAIAERLRAGGDETELGGLPDMHAMDRLVRGFDLGAVLAEYTILRRCIHDPWERHVGPTAVVPELRKLDDAIDESISHTATTYAAIRERTLRALDRISEAALGTTDVDKFLERLIQATLETTASVDSVMILLRDGDLLRVRASVGIEAHANRSYTVPIGQGFAGTIAAENAPRFVRSAANDPLVTSQALRDAGVRALYGVPLAHEGRVIGVAKMGSRTAYDFSEEDKLLFRTMAGRATGLLVQSQLVEDLRGTRQLLHALIDNAPAAIYVKDTHLRYELINQHYAAAIGVSPVDARGKTDAELFPKGAPLDDKSARNDQLVLDTGKPLSSEEVVRLDGEQRTWLSVKFPLLDAAGRPHAVCALSTDITETTKLERERARLASLLELGDACIVFDPDFRITYVNQAQERLSQTPRDQILGRVFWDVWPKAADPRGKHWTEYHRAMREQASVHFDEYYAPLDMWTDVTAYPLDDGGLVVFLRDSTERKRLEERALEARAEAEAALTRVSAFLDELKVAQERLAETAMFRERFIGILGHDLKNPLQAIVLAAAGLLKNPELLQPAQHRAIVRIARSGDRMGRLIRDVLDFTRGRLGGGIPIDRKPSDLAAAALGVVEELELARPDRTVHLETRGDLRANVDADRLAQVISNLVGNAMQYGNNDPIRVLLDGTAADLRISVVNQGNPIPPEQLAKMFEPFRRAEGKSPSQNLGLGLYIVSEIVRAHGGHVQVTSDARTGTNVTLIVPRS
jgi:PAS domain S-box-containing protein